MDHKFASSNAVHWDLQASYLVRQATHSRTYVVYGCANINYYYHICGSRALQGGLARKTLAYHTICDMRAARVVIAGKARQCVCGYICALQGGLARKSLSVYHMICDIRAHVSCQAGKARV